MNHDRSKIIYPALGFFAVVLLLFVSYSRVFDEFEYSALDFCFRIRPPQAVDDEIVIVHIGDDTIEKLGEWPIPRKYHALLIKALKSAGVRTVVFDVFFSEETEDDEGFAASVKEAGNVYLPYVFELKPDCSRKRYVSASRLIAPLIDVLKNAAKGVGFINIEPDMDGKVRHILPFIRYKGKFYPHVTVLAALNDLGLPFNPDRGIVPGKKMTAGRGHVIPLGDHSGMLVNYPAKWGKAFRHYSYVDILQSYLAGLMRQEPAVVLDELKDTVCFVGFTATASPDAHPSPCEPLYPGVGVHASVYNSILQNNFLRRLSRWGNLPILVVLWLLTGYVTVRSRKRFAFLSIVLILGTYVGMAVLCFCFLRLWIDVIYPLITMVGVYVFFTFRKYLDETRRRELLEKELYIAKDIQESFLPREIPDAGGLEISARMLTARQVGGDLYDIIPLDGTRVGVMVGDVSGKGVPAALFMARVVSVFKSFAKDGTAAEVLRKVNDRLVSEGSSGMFVTLAYMIFDTRNRILRFAAGGHLPALFVEPTGTVSFLDVEEGLPLGLMEGDFAEGKVEYEPGSVFVLYTDGVTEAMNVKKEMFEQDRLVELARELKENSAKEIVEAIHGRVAEYGGRAEQHDDITVVVVRT